MELKYPLTAQQILHLPQSAIRDADGNAVFIITAVSATLAHPTYQAVERLIQRVNAMNGIPDDAIDGGWTAAGINRYARQLETGQAKIADQHARLLTLLQRTVQIADDPQLRAIAMPELFDECRETLRQLLANPIEHPFQPLPKDQNECSPLPSA